jgi:hypothetical protein
MARPTTGVSLAPTLTAPQAAAALQEVANTGPMMQLAVSNACQNQSRGLVRTRTGTLYATGQITAAAAAATVVAGTTVDIFNVPVGQQGSGFGAILTKSETNMTQAGQLVSEAFNVERLGVSIRTASINSEDIGDDVASVLGGFWEQFVMEFHLGGQDVQTLGVLSDWPGTQPQMLGGIAAAAGALGSGIQAGFWHAGIDSVREFPLYIPTATPFKIALRCPLGITLGAAPLGGLYNIRVSLYGTSMTAIQG